VESIISKGIEGQRILDLCRAVREIQDYDNPHVALSWISLIEETEEPLKLTSKEFISFIKGMPSVVQSIYFSAIRETGEVERLTSASFMTELRRLDSGEAIKRLKNLVRAY